MLLEPEFLNLCKRLCLQDNEIDMAYLFWSRAEDAMQKKPLQKPRLLVTDSQEEIMNKVMNTEKFNLQSTIPDDNTLSVSEMQYLSCILKAELRSTGNYNTSLKRIAQNFWLRCNKDDPETYEYFDTLKRCLSAKSKLKNDTKKLAIIQSKLKKQISNHGI